jgi:hypothetical protein
MMNGHRASFLASCAARCGGPPSLTPASGPGNAILRPGMLAMRLGRLGGEESAVQAGDPHDLDQ